MLTRSPFETRLKRRLSRHPRLRKAASALRRWIFPSWHRGDSTAYWDERVSQVESGVASSWLDSEFVDREYIRPQVSGDPPVSDLDYFFDRHLAGRPASRLLTLGCGGGNLERIVLRLGKADHIDAFDDSPKSIGLARELADREGFSDRIDYTVANVNQIELPSQTYDAVVVRMALHHFENLEHVFEQVRCALLPGGSFMINEFVGPSRFQWTNLQLELMNHLFAELPEEIRRRAPVERIRRPILQDVIARDPSESVRSSEILALLGDYFEIVDLRPYGGTLLHVLLSHVLPLLDLENEEHRALLRRMMLFEKTLIERGVLPSDFVFAVARIARGAAPGPGWSTSGCDPRAIP